MPEYESIKDWLESLSSRLKRYKYRRPRCRSHKFKVMRKRELRGTSQKQLMKMIEKSLRELKQGKGETIVIREKNA